ncbi:helix-turn-helix transcriptional regulator [Nocardioides allogilvus]|uniref:helix-turn-helix transcriptional regulator n=1 Tax=Nocardioides allogilvus TaxID=2072017 RepID=UPI0018E575C5|nr:helix-turn-helix transcriptional regulator [Nocardioides allogilvus]
MDRALERALDTVERGTSLGRERRVAILAAVRRAVPFDAYAWVVTDPATGVGADPLAEVPDPSRLPALIRSKYLSRCNHWRTMPRPVSTWTGCDDERNDPWVSMLASYGVTDVASIVLEDRYGLWAFADLWRTGGSFREEEVGALTASAARLTRMARELSAQGFVPGAGPGPEGPAVLILDRSLVVQRTTPATEEFLARLLPGAGRPVPAAAYNVAAQLLARAAGDLAPARARVHLGEGCWLTLEAAWFDTGIAVTISRTTPEDRIELFTRSHGFSQQESRVLDQLAVGHDTREVAHALSIAESTVQEHLKSIFLKTGVRSRAALVARAVGTPVRGS